MKDSWPVCGVNMRHQANSAAPRIGLDRQAVRWKRHTLSRRRFQTWKNHWMPWKSISINRPLSIHPFVDGNGRIGRLLTSLLLVEWGLLPLPLLYLSAYFFQHRDDYYDLLMAVSERGAWKEWTRFFLRGVAEQAQDAIARATRLQDLQTHWHEQLAQTRASALLLRLADNLFSLPVLTIPEAREYLKVSYATAKNYVEKLIEAGILRQVGEASYGKVFYAPEILRIIGEDEE